MRNFAYKFLKFIMSLKHLHNVEKFRCAKANTSSAHLSPSLSHTCLRSSMRFSTTHELWRRDRVWPFVLLCFDWWLVWENHPRLLSCSLGDTSDGQRLQIICLLVKVDSDNTRSLKNVFFYCWLLTCTAYIYFKTNTTLTDYDTFTGYCTGNTEWALIWWMIC